MNCLLANIPAIEKIYREKCARRHEPPLPPTPAAKPEENTRNLNHDDVDAILENRRAATIEELEWLLQHANDVTVLLSNTEELELRNIAARKLAERHLAHKFDPSDEFLAKHVGVFRTQYGDLTVAEIQLLETIRLKAANAIQSCIDHQKDRCVCWAEARQRSCDLRVRSGEGSTLALAAGAVWNRLEILARTREDRGMGAPMPSANISPHGSSRDHWTATTLQVQLAVL